jgi:hypothetical protein
MTDTGTVEASEIRDRLRRWIESAWDPELSLAEWRARLADAGWACPTWPREWGGLALPAALAEVVADELADAGVPGPTDGVGMHLAIPTMLEHGSDDLKRRFLRPTLTGEIVWCQLFSEPGAGSDLAGLTTRAERHGDEWIVSGQKVWNTGAALGVLAGQGCVVDDRICMVEPVDFQQIDRGLYEPSLAKLGDTFFLTMRNDRAACPDTQPPTAPATLLQTGSTTSSVSRRSLRCMRMRVPT